MSVFGKIMGAIFGHHAEAAPAGGGRPLPLPDAVAMVAASHDLSHVISIGVRGGRMMARIYEDG